MKKRLVALLAIVFTIGIGWAVVEQVLHVNQFGGMAKDIDPLALPDNAAADSENVITDLGNGIQPRDGYIAYSTEPSKALWVFAKSNGTRYLITHSGNSLKADSGDKTFSVTISTVAPSIVTAGSQLGDYFYFCNTVDGLKRWDGTTVSVASAAMTVSQLVTWKGRLVAAGKPGAERTLYISRYLDGTAWNLALDPSDDDPAQITVGGSLDENITGLYASYKDLLVWFKNTSFGGLFGSRRSNFALRTFSESIGTNHPGTVRDCDGFLRFLGPRRTVWEFNGSDLTKISEGNNELFDAIINGESNSRTATITSQSDYDAGAQSGLSTTITPGSIMLSTWTATDTTADDFGVGTLTNVTTSTVSGDVYLSTNSNPIDNLSFETGSGTDADNWEENVDGRSSSQYYSGSYGYVGTSDYSSGGQDCGKDQTSSAQTIFLYNDITGAFCSGSFSVTTAWAQYSFSCPNIIGANVSLDLNFNKIIGLAPGSCGPLPYRNIGSSDKFIYNGNTITFYAKAYGTGNKAIAYDLIGGDPKSTIASGDIVSRTFDTATSSSIWKPSSWTSTANGNTISAETQSSDNGSSWDSLVGWTSGLAPASAFKRYIRYKISISTTTSATKSAYVSSVELNAVNNPGVFVSASQSIGSSVSSWNVFQRDETLNDGTITYGFYTDTDTTKTIGGDGLPVVGTFTSSQTITNNSIPTISTAPYAFFSAKFDITASTQNPTNDRMSITWDEGSGLKAKSVWTKQRYWLSASRASTVNNDTIFVYDRQKQWQRYTGLNALDIQLYNSYPMIGSADGILQGETTTSDSGSGIASFYTTKYFFPNGPETRGYLRDLWMTTTNSDATLATSLYHDGVATPLTLGSFVMNGQDGYQVKKLPISISDLQAVRHVAIRWDVTGTERWKILNGSLYFDPDTQRE